MDKKITGSRKITKNLVQCAHSTEIRHFSRSQYFHLLIHMSETLIYFLFITYILYVIVLCILDWITHYIHG